MSVHCCEEDQFARHNAFVTLRASVASPLSQSTNTDVLNQLATAVESLNRNVLELQLEARALQAQVTETLAAIDLFLPRLVPAGRLTGCLRRGGKSRLMKTLGQKLGQWVVAEGAPLWPPVESPASGRGLGR